MIWVLRAMVAALWLVAAVWKGVRFYDQRLFFASLAGVPYPSLTGLVVVLGGIEGAFGLLCLTGLAAPAVASGSLVAAGAFVVAKAAWPRRGGTRPPCACVPWVPRAPARTRLAAALRDVLPDVPLVLASAALWAASVR